LTFGQGRRVRVREYLDPSETLEAGSGGLASGAAGRVLHLYNDLAAGVPGLAEFVCLLDLGEREHLADLHADLAARHQLGDPSQLLRARAHHEQLVAPYLLQIDRETSSSWPDLR